MRDPFATGDTYRPMGLLLEIVLYGAGLSLVPRYLPGLCYTRGTTTVISDQ